MPAAKIGTKAIISSGIRARWILIRIYTGFMLSIVPEAMASSGRSVACSCSVTLSSYCSVILSELQPVAIASRSSMATG